MTSGCLVLWWVTSSCLKQWLPGQPHCLKQFHSSWELRAAARPGAAVWSGLASLWDSLSWLPWVQNCKNCCFTREISLTCLFLANQNLPLHNGRKPQDPYIKYRGNGIQLFWKVPTGIYHVLTRKKGCDIPEWIQFTG